MKSQDECFATFLDFEVRAPGSQVDVFWLECLPMTRFAHSMLTHFGQSFGKMSGEFLWHMLHNHNRWGVCNSQMWKDFC